MLTERLEREQLGIYGYLILVAHQTQVGIDPFSDSVAQQNKVAQNARLHRNGVPFGRPVRELLVHVVRVAVQTLLEGQRMKRRGPVEAEEKV